MRKEVIILFLVLLLLPIILSTSVDSEISRLTHYAEDYETGNIEYVQLIVYMSSVREKLNEMLGATDKHDGGILKQEQLRAVLGEPQEQTRWVWIENEEHEKLMDSYVPIWKKLVFDGNKIQIWINAYPSLFKEDIIYRLHFETQFKKPKDQLDINAKINEIKILAEEFAENPTDEAAEELAKASVNAERLFEPYMRQNVGQCIDIMKSVFGSENRRDEQKMLVQEIDLYAEDNLQVIMRLEMCDDCEWNWIGLYPWVERRGEFFEREEKIDTFSADMFKHDDFETYSKLTEDLLEEYLKAAANKDFKEMSFIKAELWAVTEAWNTYSNDVWQEIDKEFKTRRESMSQEEENKFYEDYGWIKEEQKRRSLEKELRRRNYKQRKEFYLKLFEPYHKQEFYFEQVEFEKRLVQLFREFGQEICDNNIDDNDNEQADCDDEQCSGQVCGKGEVTITDGNETITEIRNLYCISGNCQAREEEVEPEDEVICGNHICEIGEEGVCLEDCATCVDYPAMECDGKVIFKGKDKNGCPLEPICLEEKKVCRTDTECTQPLCGVASCVIEDEESAGECKITELEECKEAECVDGEKEIQVCTSEQELVSAICIEGLWEDTGVACKVISEKVTTPEETEDECQVVDDCGGANDVCSNGQCVTLPEAIEEEPEEVEEITFEVEEEIEETVEENEEPIESESAPITGDAISNFFKSFANRFSIPFITAQEGEEPPIEEPPIEEPVDITCPDAGTPPEVEENCWPKETYDDMGCISGYDVECGEWSDSGEGASWEGGGDERNIKQECGERCERECFDMKVRPCVDTCIRDECGEQFDCEADEVTNQCENSCEEEADLSACQTDCNEKCLAGEDTWEEPEWEEQQMEKGVFSAGGACRKSQGKTEAYIWLNGWGETFEIINQLKSRYYEGGYADWCKADLENFQKQRLEFEKGFDQEFVVWFFENYLANSAEDWEQHMSGIFELYWNNVDNIMQMAHRMQCLGQDDMSEYTLINVEYETEYGSIHFWEEMKTAKIPGMKKEMTVITPYMKIWIFPSEEFIKYEMKQSMKNHELPGPSEDKQEREREEGLTDEERERIKQDSSFMKIITKIADKYGGTADIVVQIKDGDEVIYNIYVPVNKEEIFKLKPMLPSEVPEEDIRIEVPFKPIYEMIYYQEKEMRGTELESPPWDRQSRRGGIKQMTSGINMYFKVRSIIKASTVYPSEAEGDMKELTKLFFKMMRGGDEGPDMEGEELEQMEKEMFEERSITGEIIKG